MCRRKSSVVLSALGPRHGFNRTLSAEAAARNVVSISRDSNAWAISALNFIGHDAKALHRKLQRQAQSSQRALQELHVSTNICSDWPRGPGEDAHIEYLRELVAPRGNQEILTHITAEWLDDKLESHARALARIATENPKLYYALLDGRLGTAVRIGLGAQLDSAQLIRIVGYQARMLLISAAHQKISFIRAMSTDPFAGRFSGFARWKSVGHVLLATVAVPATVVQQVCAAYENEAPGKSADTILASLVSQKLLPLSQEGQIIFDAAKLAGKELSSSRARARLRKRVATIVALSAPAAQIDSNILKAERLSRLSFVEHRLGLSASEAATFVAIELLKALGAVNSLIEAMLLGKELPSATSQPSAWRCMFASALLRAEGQPDRDAAQLGKARGLDGGLDPYNMTAKQPLLKLRAKLQIDPQLSKACDQSLGLDTRGWFRQ